MICDSRIELEITLQSKCALQPLGVTNTLAGVEAENARFRLFTELLSGPSVSECHNTDQCHLRRLALHAVERGGRIAVGKDLWGMSTFLDDSWPLSEHAWMSKVWAINSTRPWPG